MINNVRAGLLICGNLKWHRYCDTCWICWWWLIDIAEKICVHKVYSQIKFNGHFFTITLIMNKSKLKPLFKRVKLLVYIFLISEFQQGILNSNRMQCNSYSGMNTTSKGSDALREDLIAPRRYTNTLQLSYVPVAQSIQANKCVVSLKKGAKTLEFWSVLIAKLASNW